MPCLFFPFHFDPFGKLRIDSGRNVSLTFVRDDKQLLGVEILFQGGVKGQGTRAMRRQVRGLNAFVIKR